MPLKSRRSRRTRSRTLSGGKRRRSKSRRKSRRRRSKSRKSRRKRRRRSRRRRRKGGKKWTLEDGDTVWTSEYGDTSSGAPCAASRITSNPFDHPTDPFLKTANC